MEEQFLNAIQQNDAEVLKRCLRIYASVDRVNDAERLLKTKIIAPYLENIITSKNFHQNDLSGICQDILQIIPEKLDLLLKLAKKKKKSKNHNANNKNVSDFNFVTNALWLDLAEKFERNLPIVFSAGNPDQFHKNYVTIMDFIKKLEISTGEVLLHSTKVVQSFIHRWESTIDYSFHALYLYGHACLRQIAGQKGLKIESPMVWPFISLRQAA